MLFLSRALLCLVKTQISFPGCFYSGFSEYVSKANQFPWQIFNKHLLCAQCCVSLPWAYQSSFFGFSFTFTISQPTVVWSTLKAKGEASSLPQWPRDQNVSHWELLAARSRHEPPTASYHRVFNSKKKKGAWGYSSDQIGKVSAFKSHICGRDKDHTCNLSCGDKFFEVKYNWVKRLKSEGVDTVF